MRTAALNKLSAVKVRQAGPGMHSDGGGLFLRVTGKARSWVFRFTREGRKREMGLGSLGAVSLQTARQMAQECREQVAQGLDPIEARKASLARPEAAAGTTTFRTAMERYLKLKGVEWSNAKHAAQWRSTLEAYCERIMPMPVETITAADVVACLAPIWTEKQETASRVRQRTERILSACIALGERPAPNPAAWRDGLEHVLSKQTKAVRHHAAVPVTDAPEAFAKLWVRRDVGQGAAALVLVALTALRSGEARWLEWADIEAGTITIPAARMKARRAHRVALCGIAADWLATLPRIGGCALVFPSSRLGPISNMTISKAMKGADLGAYTPHGWRSTFSDWANESGWPRDHIEDALAHRVGSETERAYRRGDWLEQRRPLMDAWCNYLTSGLNSL